MAYNQSFPGSTGANIPIDLINMFNNPYAPNNSLSTYISNSLSSTFSNSYSSSPPYNFYPKFYNSTGTAETFSLLKPGTINYTINGTADITTLFGGISKCFYCTYSNNIYTNYQDSIPMPTGCTNINYIIIGGGGAGQNSDQGGGGDGFGGGGGAFVSGNYRFINPNIFNSVNITVGAGGLAGNVTGYSSASSTYFAGAANAGANGMTGNNTILTFNDTNLIMTAQGGGGGTPSLDNGGEFTYQLGSTGPPVTLAVSQQYGAGFPISNSSNIYGVDGAESQASQGRVLGGYSGFDTNLTNNNTPNPGNYKFIPWYTPNTLLTNAFAMGTNNYYYLYGLAVNQSSLTTGSTAQNVCVPYVAADIWSSYQNEGQPQVSTPPFNYTYFAYGSGGYGGIRSQSTFAGYINGLNGVNTDDTGAGAAGAPGLVIFFYRYD